MEVIMGIYTYIEGNELKVSGLFAEAIKSKIYLQDEFIPAMFTLNYSEVGQVINAMEQRLQKSRFLDTLNRRALNYQKLTWLIHWYITNEDEDGPELNFA